MRASQLFIPTLREDPGDAEAVSHKLLVRGGFIRQVSAGLWSFTPLGWRVHRKIEQIIREEMDAIGGQEMLMPVLTPAELWEATGRIAIPEIFRVKDRARSRLHPAADARRDGHVPRTRAPELPRILPQLWYHFQTKDRDEPRPRGGLLRVHEFIMKDAYSFDRDEEGVRTSFEANRDAYKKIFAPLRARDVRRPGGERDHGRQVQHRLPGAVRLGREHARPLRERRLRRRPRGGGGRSERRRPARSARRARGDRHARGDDDRGSGRAPGDRPVGDLESDADRQAGQDSRARARPRR